MDSLFHSSTSHGFFLPTSYKNLLLLPPTLLSSHLSQNPRRNLPKKNQRRRNQALKIIYQIAMASSRPSFSEVDDGLASIAEFSGNPFSHRNMLVSRTACCTAAPPRRRGSLRNLGSFGASSPRSVPGRVVGTRFDEANFNPPHFLDSCFLCKKPLINRDIFMYRGDIPFCSEDCRKEQMDMDEALEQSRSLSASMKAMRSKQKDSSSAQQASSSSSPGKSQKYPFRAGIAAA